MGVTIISGPGIVPHADFITIASSLVVVYLLSQVISTIYIAFFGPLSHFPGPKSRALSILPFARTTWLGKDNEDVPELHRKYGNVVRTAPDKLSFVGNAQIFKDMYGFRKHGAAEVVKDHQFYTNPVNRVDGLITADGPTHSRQRKIVSHAFSDRALKEQEPMLKKWALMLKDKLMEQVQQGKESNMVLLYNCATFDIMADLTFAEPLHMLEGGDYVPWVKTIFASIKKGTKIRVMRSLGPYIRWAVEEMIFRVPSLRAKQVQHFKYATDRVDLRLAKTPDRPDLFTRILEKSQSQTDSLNIQELYSIGSFFMLAGTETTATALSGTTYHLLNRPNTLLNLQNEIREACKCMDDLHLETLARLPILEATLKEGLRMYPPVPTGLPRVSPPGGMTIGGRFIPEGTSVSVHHLATYRDEENFKYPDQFRPERWLGDPKFKDDNQDALEPFSVGPRNCLGKNLAWHEMRLLLATVLLHFDLELLPESENWADQKVYTIWEKSPLMCKLTAVTS